MSPPDPELGRHNREVLADRIGWPAGALEACERLEAEHRGWCVAWMAENRTPGFERKPGFYAWRVRDEPGCSSGNRWGRRREWYGANVEELLLRLGLASAAHQPDRDTFRCTSCSEAWPCPPAREYLLATTPDRSQLAMRLAAELDRAVSVLGAEPPDVLFDRFLAWTRTRTDHP